MGFSIFHRTQMCVCPGLQSIVVTFPHCEGITRVLWGLLSVPTNVFGQDNIITGVA